MIYSMRTIVLSVFLLFSFIVNHSNAACVDDPDYRFQDNPCEKLLNKCLKKASVRRSCPLSCGLCPTPPPVSEVCEDKASAFKVSGLANGSKKKCTKWSRYCNESSGRVAKNCPATCNLCGGRETSAPTATPIAAPVTCKNKKNGKFKIPNMNAKKNCRKWSMKFCEEKSGTVAKNCAKSCNTCVSLTKPPTPKPTPSPTPKPTPSPQCKLEGKLYFPRIPKSPTFHAERLFVTTKRKRDMICSDQQRTTPWGCTLSGDASIHNEDDAWTRRRALATVIGASGGSYKFTIQHEFDDKEKAFEISAVPVFVITANGVELGKYNLNENRKIQTHNSDGFVNNNYKDNTFVDVTCNDACVCTSVKSMPICPIRAEIRMPEIDSDADTANTGYHREGISVNLSGSDEECSIDSTLTKWCTHEGKAEFYRPSEDYYQDYESISTSESVVIPEAQNESFEFEIKHIYDYYETYYDNDHALNGDIILFLGDKEKIFKRSADEDTHIKSSVDGTWIPNPDYHNEMYLHVSCDSECECDVKEHVPPVCKIDAVLEFPPFPDSYYGYHSSGVTASKEGDDDDFCGYYYYGTSWGCESVGEAVNSNYKDDTDYIYNTVQTLNIRDALDSSFTFYVEHYYSEVHEQTGDTDHTIAELDIKVNGVSIGEFKRPNPEYEGTISVGLQCDEDCNCVANKLVN